MSVLRREVLIFLLLMSGACGAGAHPAATSGDLLARDRAWARAAASGNLDSIVAYWSDDARVIMPGEPILVGKQAIRAMVSASLAVPGFRIAWTPDSAVVSAAGDLGYTFGTNQVTAPDSIGHLATTTGRYVTTWRREQDGQWHCTVDTYNVGPLAAAEPGSPPPARTP